MSRTRRKFSPRFKADLCVELLKGEKRTSTPWLQKTAFFLIFCGTGKRIFWKSVPKPLTIPARTTGRKNISLSTGKKEDYAKKVGQLAMQVDWLKKKSEEVLGPGYEDKFSQSLSRKVNPALPGKKWERTISVRTAAGLLSLNRTGIYYKHRDNKPAEEELACKALLDRVHTDNPSWGARQLSKQLRMQGFKAGRFRTMRFMRGNGHRCHLSLDNVQNFSHIFLGLARSSSPLPEIRSSWEAFAHPRSGCLPWFLVTKNSVRS